MIIFVARTMQGVTLIQHNPGRKTHDSVNEIPWQGLCIKALRNKIRLASKKSEKTCDEFGGKWDGWDFLGFVTKDILTFFSVHRFHKAKQCVTFWISKKNCG